MATVINKRDVALQAASPRTASVNLGSTVNVNGTVDGVSATTVKNNAATAAAHAATIGNPHNVSLTQISGDLDDINDGVTFFRTTANQVTGAGRGFNALNSSSEYIKSLKSTQLTVVSSNPSTGWVGDVNGIRMYQSGVLKVNIPVSGSPSFSGNLDIDGTAEFNGTNNVSGVLYCGVFNSSGSVAAGIYARGNSSGGFGVFGDIPSGNILSIGVKGRSTGGRGVEGTSTTGVGVYASSATGTALSVQGPMNISTTTLVSNLNADMVDGKHASALCQIVPTDSGTCTVSGNGFNLNVTGGLAATVRTRGTGNTVFIENVSDARLKQDIQDEVYGLDFINSLKPRSFRMRSNPDLLAHGLIYQEVAKLIGNKDALASLNPDATGAVDYNGIVSPMIKAIQELSQRVKHLEIRRN